jgi:hypothetical protein
VSRLSAVEALRIIMAGDAKMRAMEKTSPQEARLISGSG